MSFSKEVINEARIRRMRPDDYARQTAECEAAERRLAEIDRKNLDAMKAEALEEIEEYLTD